MPAIGNTTLNDGQATPVAHVFYPVKNSDGVTIWEDRTTGTPVAYPRLTFTSRRNAKDSLFVPSFRIDIPIVETPSGGIAQRVATGSFEGRGFIPDRITAQQRADLLAYVRNFAASSNFGVVMLYNESYF